MNEETFGPAIPIMTYRTFDEAIALANDSKYGLGANLYTYDPLKAKRFFEEVEAGTLWINDPLTDKDAGPFGGFKMSGMGRELGEEGLEVCFGSLLRLLLPRFIRTLPTPRRFLRQRLSHYAQAADLGHCSIDLLEERPVRFNASVNKPCCCVASCRANATDIHS